MGRQKRITLDGDHFYPDLVFYHTRLKCYVVIDLKTTKLTHGDLGQMQLYVHYYDREVAEDGDNPTLGLILCTDKNDAVVRFVLDKEDQSIFASRYKLHLPTEEGLQAELKKEMASLTGGPTSPSTSRERRSRTEATVAEPGTKTYPEGPPRLSARERDARRPLPVAQQIEASDQTIPHQDLGTVRIRKARKRVQ